MRSLVYQIRQASSTTPAVLIRQLEAIRRLAPRLPDTCFKRCRIKRTRSSKLLAALGAWDRRDLDAARQRARTALEALPPARDVQR